MIKVFTDTYKNIFKNYSNISIPEYQRPYRWSSDKLEELLGDLEEFFITKPKKNLEYYLGSILFFYDKKEGKHELIDGQQRLTTLILLQYSINRELNDNQNLHFDNHISFYNIKNNLSYLEKKKNLLAKLSELNFIDKLRLTVIVSDNEDNAFAFFDSQNNRGVTLGADDYLKAYHLREVVSENLQEKLAQQWEQAVYASQVENNYEAGLLHLFYKILYRSRQWKGQSQLIPEDKDSVLKTFQKQTLKSPSENAYELFPSKFNQKYKSLMLNVDDSIELLAENAENKDVRDFPFSLRQPLFKGHNFFQYTQKYHAVHQLLFSNSLPGEPSIEVAIKYYKSIYTENMSLYLRHYIKLCIVMYYDSFGGSQIDKAVKYFDYLIGSIRIEKYYVKKEAIKNSLINSSNNLLDVIANAYTPQEIFDFIIEQSQPKIIYGNIKFEDDGGVRSSYKKRVLSYFNKSGGNLNDRLLWIK